MASYNPVVITDKGQEALFKSIAGQYGIQFTTISFGAGDHADSEDLTKLTALSDARQTVPVTSLVIPATDSVIVKARVNNNNLQSGYRIKEIGVFCKDGNDANSDTILYAIITTAIPDYMPAIVGNEAPTEFSYSFGLGVGNASTVTIQNSSSTGYYNQAEVDALLANYYTKSQIDEMLSPAT